MELAYKVETLRDFLHFRKISISAAAAELGVTRQYLGAVLSGSPCGRKLALRIEDWSNGAISADSLIRMRNGEGAACERSQVLP